MKKRKNRGGGVLSLAVIFILGAVLIKILSFGDIDGKIVGYISKIPENTKLVRLAMAIETPFVDMGESKKMIRLLAAESALVARMENKDAEKKEEEKKREELTVWEYTPGGEKKEKTYPIENITINPSSEKGYVCLNNIKVKNSGTKGIDLKWLLGAKLPFKLSGDGPHVLIIHTHGSECYFPQGKEEYTLDDVERTSDKRYNMIRVGDELEKALQAEGIATIHDRNIYDSPSYNGSYTRALSAIGEALKKNPSIKVVIDVHRDAMTSSDGVKYRTVAEVNGERVAQMMLVMSSGESGLKHPDWAENLKLAVKLQDAMATKYPGIMRPMNLRKERFNMHATKGSMLVEVGTSANSLAEAIASVKLLGKELATILKTAK